MRNNSKIRRTKIVCTLGPSSSSPEKIKELILAGMDVVRLNFSHGDHDTHRNTIRSIRRVSKEVGKEIGILQDLCGPKIRIGQLSAGDLKLNAGDFIFLSSVINNDINSIPINYPYLTEDINIGDPILMADGLIEVVVETKEEEGLKCRVITGGVISSHKGVNFPSSNLRVVAFTKKDRQDLVVGLEEEVDFVALSFVRHEDDLEPICEILNHQERRPLLIAKIEKPQAIERLDYILAKVDGLMVARGDLGVEMPLEEVPMIQKKLIKIARQAAKPVITATQMLRSMMVSPRPTRAEATDVANAILDGTDALMLSEETAVGNYPVEAVNILHRIAVNTEPHLRETDFLNEPRSDLLVQTEASISRSACWLAQDLNAAAIMASTSSGSTARLVSRFRPSKPIAGLTPHLRTLRQMTLSWGVIPFLVDFFSDTDQMFDLSVSWAVENGIANTGDCLIVTAGVPINVAGGTNLLKVIKIGADHV